MVQGLQSKTGDFGIHVPESPSLPFNGKDLRPLFKAVF